MSLLDVLKNRGCTFRQHLEELGWGYRKPTSVDLSDEQRLALETQGLAGLQQAMQATNQWTFPAMDITALLPCQRDVLVAQGKQPVAVVVIPSGDQPHWRAAADRIIQQVKEKSGVTLRCVDDTTTSPQLLDEQHLILLGGSQDNALALQLALRLHTFFLDAAVPGQGGWAVVTHAGLLRQRKNILQIAADAHTTNAAVDFALSLLTQQKDTWQLTHGNRVVPGPIMAAHQPSWENFVASVESKAIQIASWNTTPPTDPVALADYLAPALDSGGIDVSWYNLGPVVIAVDSARYYRLTGDRRALVLFRELLLRLSDYYLKHPGGASYISDLDFQLGFVILYYARLEHEDVFTPDDRLLISNLLLSLTRSVYEYARAFWPVTPGGRTRHNHETFPALALMYASSYFAQYNIADVDTWRTYPRDVFDSDVYHRFKQRENSAAYEVFVPTHAAMYSTYTGQGLERFSPGVLAKMVQRLVMATDNFLRQVDYGDSALNMQPVDPGMARLLATQDPQASWYASAGFHAQPRYLPPHISEIPGLRLHATGQPPAGNQWEVLPLDQPFIEDSTPGFPLEYSLDKLVLRTGWQEDNQYIMLEGVGGRVSHTHYDAGGITRYNHLGRHWIVKNGYGKRPGVTNSSKAFAGRVTGPEDHNLLIVSVEGKTIKPMPPAALLHHSHAGQLFTATVAVPHLGPLHWARTVVILQDQYLMVIDRVNILTEGQEKAHVEYNVLGSLQSTPHGVVLDQQGVQMHITSPSQWQLETGVSDQSTCWEKNLKSGVYPYASFPLGKLLFHLPSLHEGDNHTLATLFVASKTDTPAYSLTQTGADRWTVQGDHAGTGKAIATQDLTIQPAADHYAIELAPAITLPQSLRNWRLVIPPK